MLSTTTWVFVIVLLLVWGYMKCRNDPNRIKLPGPWTIPILGNMLQVERRMYRTFYKWGKQYGPLCKFQIGNKETVLVSDYKLAKEMLATDAFIGRGTVDAFTLYEGENIGLINSEGAVWEQQRRFIVRQLRDWGFGKSSMESMIMEEVNELGDRLANRNGQPVEDMKNELSLAMVNSLWSIVAGTRYNQEDPKLRTLAKQLNGAFDEAAKAGGVVALIPWVKYVLPEYSGYNAIRRMMSGLVDFVATTVKQHKESIQADSPRDFIDVYLNEIESTTDHDSSFYGDAAEKQLIAVVADLYQAGADATATILTWTILHLLKQPEAQRKLQAEIQDVTNNSRSVTFEDRPKLPYTQAVINEVLRFAAPPFGVPHRVLFDTEFKGIFFPSGTFFMINLFYIHNDPKLWGDPENFRPERFLTADGKELKKIDYLNPFLQGRRQCPGETLAKDTVFLFLTNLIQRFDLVKDPSSPEPDTDPAVSFIITPKPYKVIFKERK